MEAISNKATPNLEGDSRKFFSKRTKELIAQTKDLIARHNAWKERRGINTSSHQYQPILRPKPVVPPLNLHPQQLHLSSPVETDVDEEVAKIFSGVTGDPKMPSKDRPRSATPLHVEIQEKTVQSEPQRFGPRNYSKGRDNKPLRTPLLRKLFIHKISPQSGIQAYLTEGIEVTFLRTLLSHFGREN